MKSALIKRIEDKSCVPQHRPSSGNTSIEREEYHEIGSRGRTDRSRALPIATSSPQALQDLTNRDRTMSRCMDSVRTAGLKPSRKSTKLYSVCEMSITHQPTESSHSAACPEPPPKGNQTPDCSSCKRMKTRKRSAPNVPHPLLDPPSARNCRGRYKKDAGF
jgi:hypothetical protein